MAEIKTNVMRILESAGVDYQPHYYDTSDGHIDGIAVAQKLHQDEGQTFKTLVAQGASGEYVVFVVPVAEHLHLKKAAQASKQKSVSMIPVKEITKVTGYVRGGCSPIGMKKPYAIYIDETAILYDTIIVSGGKIGTQVELPLEELCRVTGGTVVSLTD